MIKTLVDLLPRLRRLGHREALRYFNGFRSWKVSYIELLERSGSCSRYFETQGIKKGDRIILWGENRPEWVAVFWAAVLRGVQVVPADSNSSAAFVKQIQRETESKLIVHGQDVDISALKGLKLSFDDIQDLAPAGLHAATINADDVVEIVYTSGTTSEPKGVVHRHRNICANLRPFAEEFRRYRLIAAPFQPIRLLNLLPLSHMFGQSMGLFIPLLLGGSCVFTHRLSPPSIMEALRRERVSVLVAVPRIVEQLRQYVTGTFRSADEDLRTSGLISVLERWLRHKDFHFAAGLKFWAIVVGGAPLPEDLERFWASLGVLVIQGYGLTEASPVVALNHPFKAKVGSIGRPIKGQEVKIAGDGEILIRGENVVTQYLPSAGSETPTAQDGWLHTGDLGEFDQNGNLRFKGRKRDIIVTSEGLNVYPQDVERALDRLPEVSGSVVVGLVKNGEEHVHAVLIMKEKVLDLQEIIRQANRTLEPHQRIQSWTIWPHDDFPRTPSTLKVDRRRIVEQILSGPADAGPTKPSGEEEIPELFERLLAQSPGSTESQYHLELDLGLSSLDRIELFSRLQERHTTQLDEATFAELSTIGEISNWLKMCEERHATTESFRQASNIPGNTTPRWTRCLPVRVLRDAVQAGVIVPIFRRYIAFSVLGIDQLDDVTPPVIFAANHNSNLDTIALLAALPYVWRKRLAPAIRQEYFAAHFGRGVFTSRERIRNSFEYYLACWLFNTFPIPQKMGGIQRTLRYAGELVENGYCPLIFPEGSRSSDGNIKPFLSGVGVMAIHLRVPVLPVHIGGLYEVLSQFDTWPKPGRCTLRIGTPLKFAGNTDPKQVARQVEASVRKLGAL